MKRSILALIAGALLVASTAMAQSGPDTYVYQSFGEVVSLDPARAYDTASGGIIENIYETLFLYAGDAIDEFEPALATDYTVSDDGLHWTFNLRDGVQFHSGNTMSCKDVEYSFQYGALTAHPQGATAYLTGNLFLGYSGDGSDPAAFQENVTWEMIDNIVECPEGPDGLVAVVNLVNPTPALIPILTYTAYSILDSQWAIDGGSWDGTEATWKDWNGRDITTEFLSTNPSGTGAYELVEWTDDAVVARAFENYWGGAPSIQNVVYQFVDEQSTRILALQQGDADRIQVNERSTLVQLRGAPGVTVHEEPDWSPTCVTPIHFNFQIDTANNEDVGSGQLDGNGIPADFFTDVDVRRAFAHLFDQQGFVDQIYEGAGVVLTMGLPPSFLGYNDDVAVRTLDLEAAEEYFRAAYDGELWDTGFEFTAIYNAGNTVRQAALEIIADNLSFVNPNFVMNVRSLPWADVLNRMSEKKIPMFVVGWCADYADPSNFINTFYDNDGYYAGRTSINIPEIQALIDEADATFDPAERGFIYREIGTLHYDLAPNIVLPNQSPFMVTRDNLQGVYYNPMLSTDFYWKDISKN